MKMQNFNVDILKLMGFILGNQTVKSVHDSIAFKRDAAIQSSSSLGISIARSNKKTFY